MPRLLDAMKVIAATNPPDSTAYSRAIAMAQHQRQKFALITGCTPGGIGYVDRQRHAFATDM